MTQAGPRNLLRLRKAHEHVAVWERLSLRGVRALSSAEIG